MGRRVYITQATVEADAELTRERPGLVAGKYARMAEHPYAFFRGAFPLFLHDLSTGELPLPALLAELPVVPSIGDLHFENFGTLHMGRAPGGVVRVAERDAFSLEPNDFDSADLWPASCDLVRLGGSLHLAALLSKDRPRLLRDVPRAIRELVRGYVSTLVAVTSFEAPPRVALGMGGPLVDDLFHAALEQGPACKELDTFAERGAGHAPPDRLRRGPVDGDTLADLPSFVTEELPAALERYRGTLLDPPPARELEVLDAARLRGRGVGSYPLARLLVLVRGDEHRRILELKEQGPTRARAFTGSPRPPLETGPRILACRGLWSRPDADASFGVTELGGLSMQVRRESAGRRTLRARVLDKRHTEARALTPLARALGSLVGRLHGSQVFGGGPQGWSEGLADREVELSRALEATAAEVARRATSDWEHFREAHDELGPVLGAEPGRASDPRRAALFDDP